MVNPGSTHLTRREWLGRFSTPAVLAALAPVASAATTVTPAAGPPAGSFNIRDHGAAGDGTTLDTTAVQAAIDACSAAGGGTVLVPAGDFLVGTIELKSHVTLHLVAQGRLLGSGDPAHYRAGRGVPPSNGNLVLLSAAGAENITLEGCGTIDGNGARFFTGRGDNTGPGQKSADGYFQRPHLLVFFQCKNLRLRGVFLTASAYHAVRILQCEHVGIEGVRIHNRVNKNNDGFHFSSCRYVHVTNCDVTCQDDACALFGSNRFVTVANCSFSTRWSVFRFGGGESENIAITNCLIYETYGCPVKMRCGARSRFENITFSNLILQDVTGPISIGLDSISRRRDGTAPTPGGVVRNIAFNGIRATVAATGRQHDDLPFPSEYRPGETRTCITLNGVGDEYLENISFTDVHVTYEGGGTVAEAAALEVPRIAGEYFEIGTPPAYGCYARNVRGLTLHQVRFELRQPDARPALVFDHVSDAALNGFSAQGSAEMRSLLRFSQARDVLLTACRALTPVAVFLHAAGPDCSGIVVDGGDLAKAAVPVETAAGTAPAAVRYRS